MDDINVSICVAYYNRSEYVKECVQSLLDQDFNSFEVIVVNDGSTDPLTGTFLDEFDDARLRVIHQKNAGFVGAIRAAIDASKGAYIAIQGAGDVSLPSRIKKQVEVLENKPQVGIVSCLFENVVFGGKNDGARKKRGYNNSHISADDFLAGSNPLGHGEVMFRRSLYDKVGGYRPYFKFSQDLDLWLLMIDHCEVEIIQEYLYERRMFMKDGVSTDGAKQFLQKYLAEFARQCYRDRKLYGKDLIDLYGVHAGLFRYPNKNITGLIASKCTDSLLNENGRNLDFYLRFVKGEPLTWKLAVVLILAKIYKTNLGKVIVPNLISIFKTK
ncbi:Glycosyl transferase 2 family protein [Alteromonas sp. 38]|uniref:glycosyltransferase family 2 protein n=1 Tax=unclassified Alteromonas TaxID=2614992 RepID=UPI0012F0B637|nr:MULTISPECIES: glycosyltransferase [unclassified Alteromonas]CAD5280388.1 Glycosyl transferase 2 family protein [Alteromonas sp. 154]VXB80276.1 Glycosyl transferase 2 family protein [Alteromonas sp. 38]